MIRLFPKTATTWTTQGLGELGATRCLVTEERNGAYELEMDVPITDKHYADLELGRLILVKPNPYENPEPFRIYQISRPMSGLVTVNAAHISYDLSKIADKPFTATTISQTMSRLKSYAADTCPFTFSTDKSVTKDFKVATPRSIRSLLAGSEGSVLDVYGTGEWKFTGYTCYLYLNRGQNRGVTIRYGKNLTDLKQEENNATVYSKLYPFWADSEGNLVTLSEVTLDINANGNGTLVYDMSDRWDTAPTMADLRTAAQAYIDNNDLGTPVVNLTLSFVQISQLIRDAIYLCDTLSVEFPALGVSAQAKVIKTVYDVLLDRYNTIEVGSVKKTFAQTIASLQSNSIVGDVGKSVMQAAIDKATALITGNAGSGNIILHDTTGNGIPNELLFLNTTSIDTATDVWRWTMGGLGFSSNGYAGPYGLAIDQSGSINASFITVGDLNAGRVTTGILTDALGRNSWNLDTGELTISASGNIASIKTYYAESVDNVAPQWDVPKAYLYDADGKNLYDSNGDRLVAKLIWRTTPYTNASTMYRWQRQYIVYTDGTTELTSAVPMQDYYGRANLVLMMSTDGDGNPIGIMSGEADYISLRAGQLEIKSPQFTLDRNGNASFAGNLSAATGSFSGAVTATSLTLSAGVSVPSSKVSGLAAVATSGSYSDLGDTPNLTVYVAKDGTIGTTPADGVDGFVVSSAGVLKASNAIIYGSLYSSSGTIGGMTLSSNSIYKGTNSMASTTPGVYLGTDGLRLYGSSSNYFNVTSAGVMTLEGGTMTGSSWTSSDGTTQLDNNGLTLRNAASDAASVKRVTIHYASSTPRIDFDSRSTTSDPWATEGGIKWSGAYGILLDVGEVDASYLSVADIASTGTIGNASLVYSPEYYVSRTASLTTQMDRFAYYSSGVILEANEIYLHGTKLGSTVSAQNTSSVSVSNNTTTNVCSISLTAGTWIVTAEYHIPVATSDNYRLIAAISTASADYQLQAGGYNNIPVINPPQAAVAGTLARIITVSTNTPVYLTMNQNSGGSKTLTANRNRIVAVFVGA